MSNAAKMMREKKNFVPIDGPETADQAIVLQFLILFLACTLPLPFGRFARR